MRRKDGLSPGDLERLDEREKVIADRRKVAGRVRREVEVWDGEGECKHGRLPGDSLPHIGAVPIGYHFRGGRLEARCGPPVLCGCWAHRTVGVNTADELLEKMATLTGQVEALAKASRSQWAAINALTEVLAHVDRNVLAVGAQVRGDRG